MTTPQAAEDRALAPEEQLSPAELRRLATLLCAAVAPAALSPRRNAFFVEMALVDALAAPAPGEGAEAAPEVLEVLRSAIAPSEIAHERLAALVDAVLADESLWPASADELAAAAELRDALQGGSAGSHPDAALAVALRAAVAPAAPPLGAVKRHSEDAVAPQRGRSNVIYVAFGGATAALALAAAVALWLRPAQDGAASGSAEASGVERARSRSTATLFDAQFAAGEQSARLDVIAQARARDLRENRYASWGAR